jgi:hypothetical protein
MVSCQIRHFLRFRTETGRANHCAVGAGKAAFSDFFPVRIAIAAVKKFFHTLAIYSAALLIFRCVGTRSSSL